LAEINTEFDLMKRDESIRGGGDVLAGARAMAAAIARAHLSLPVVMLCESGVSSTPRPRGLSLAAVGYWFARFRGR
jgi:hypothetical protein